MEITIKATNMTKINIIGDCVIGKQKRAGNFLWKFKLI